MSSGGPDTAVPGYDRTGVTYASTRRPDPRISSVIDRALAEMASVANIGAGTGSYEPPQTVVAVEPSGVMLAQRPPGTAPALRAVARRLPLRTDAVDAALAVLTVHHWRDLQQGIDEMKRIARRRIVILTWDHTVTRDFWLLREYLPAAAETDRRLAVPLNRLTDLLGADSATQCTVTPVPVPHDCLDGFGAAYWRRPEAYLESRVQAGMSMLALTPQRLVCEGLDRLRSDIDSGAWYLRHIDLLGRDSLDLGYRLVVADMR